MPRMEFRFDPSGVHEHDVEAEKREAQRRVEEAQAARREAELRGGLGGLQPNAYAAITGTAPNGPILDGHMRARVAGMPTTDPDGFLFYGMPAAQVAGIREAMERWPPLAFQAPTRPLTVRPVWHVTGELLADSPLAELSRGAGPGPRATFALHGLTAEPLTGGQLVGVDRRQTDRDLLHDRVALQAEFRFEVPNGVEVQRPGRAADIRIAHEGGLVLPPMAALSMNFPYPAGGRWGVAYNGAEGF